MKVSLFDYELDAKYIAQTPTARRGDSRLLVLERETGRIEHRHFRNIGEYMRAGDLLVINDTRVIPARVFGVRKTLGKVEALFLEQAGEKAWRAMLGSKGRIKEGERLKFGDGAITVEVTGKDEEGIFTVVVEEPEDLVEALERVGHMPVPPYIKRKGAAAKMEAVDIRRYQTVYAARSGAVAAPTAGLHFTEGIFDTLRQSGVRIAQVTLHVGLGTFRPVKCEDIEAHVMHREYFEVGEETAAALRAARSDGRRIIAVGTTTARVLESLPEGETKAAKGWTEIFIYPPYRFRLVDAMVTNFHLPKSTLLMMVSAFAGRTKVLAAYEEAKREGYRFFSYGDAMFIF